MRNSQDGFVLAQRDLELRGPGEVLGTRQTGLIQMRIANLMRDRHLLAKVQQAAEIIVGDYPQIIDPLIHRWLADGEKYAGV